MEAYMSMHLVGPWMTTTNYKKRKQKGRTKKDIEAQKYHDKWLRKMGAHPDQITESKKKNANSSILSVPDYRSSGNSIPTSDVIPGGSTAPQERQIYSGERRLLGVATMHKSNMVPVFDRDDAKDIAQMRRN
tara:strand:- start:6379 stop:6774 length:396 start_codon:yes stop_codon:yes gene_type:complete